MKELFVRLNRNLPTKINVADNVHYHQVRADNTADIAEEKPLHSYERLVIEPKVKEPSYKKFTEEDYPEKDYVTYKALEKKSGLVSQPYLKLLKSEHSLVIFGDLSENICSDYCSNLSVQDSQLIGIVTSKCDPSKLYFRNTHQVIENETYLAKYVVPSEQVDAAIANSSKGGYGVSVEKRGAVIDEFYKNSNGLKEVGRLDLMMDFYKDNSDLTKEKQQKALINFINNNKEQTGIELSYDWCTFGDGGFFRIYQTMESAHWNWEQGIATFMSSSDPMDLALSIAENSSNPQYKEQLLYIVKDYPDELLEKHSNIADSDSRFKYSGRLDLKDRIIALGHDKNPLLKNRLLKECAISAEKVGEIIPEQGMLKEEGLLKTIVIEE